MALENSSTIYLVPTFDKNLNFWKRKKGSRKKGKMFEGKTKTQADNNNAMQIYLKVPSGESEDEKYGVDSAARQVQTKTSSKRTKIILLKSTGTLSEEERKTKKMELSVSGRRVQTQNSIKVPAQLSTNLF